MITSVGTKSRKKQSSLSAPPVAASSRQFEHALLSLDNVCLRILDGIAYGRGSNDDLYWHQMFQHIATPLSLALAEYRGPRRFHYHYRHRKDDESILSPVLENPLDTLAAVCSDALRQCRGNMVGMENDRLIEMRRSLETALVGFTLRYREYKKQA